MRNWFGSPVIVQTKSTGLCVGLTVGIGPAAVGGCVARASGAGPQAAPYRTIPAEINTNKVRVFMIISPYAKVNAAKTFHPTVAIH